MRTALLICTAVLLAPGSAHAATAMVGADGVVYRAAPGEQNDLTVRFAEDEATWTLTDSGAIVVAQAPCVPVDPHTARCVASNRIDADLGDRDDRFSSSSGDFEPSGLARAHGGSGHDVLDSNDAAAALFGGEGDDVLRVRGVGEEGGLLNGGPGDDDLRGGPEFDVLEGGGGRDEMRGGAGGDVMNDGDGDEPGPDLFVGGSAGCCLALRGDQVSYRGRSAPVHVDLADAKPDGAAGEGDVLVGIEAVEGGSAADRLLGDDRANSLIGRPGHDLLVGRGGGDVLMPGIGGGLAACGAGRDRVGPTTTRDRLTRDCEALAVSDPDIFELPARPARPAPGRLFYVVRCPENVDDEVPIAFVPCSGALHLREAGGAHRLLGVGSFPRGRWERRRFDVALTPLGRRLVGRRVLTTLRLGIRPRGSRTLTVRWTIALRL
jgi:Ca2+-binding RTX toxin-like protein